MSWSPRPALRPEIRIPRPDLRSWGALLVAVACLVAAALGALVVGSIGNVVLVAVIVPALLVVALAVVRPESLLFLYCAAIPFNFVLPPGPAGTVARIAGLAFFAGYVIREPWVLRPWRVPLIGWAFVAWALASTLWAIRPQTAFAEWASVAQLFAITVLITSMVARSPGLARRAMWAYALSATVTALIGSISYLQSAVAFVGRAAPFSGQDPALFASLLLPACAFLMGELEESRSRVSLRALAAGALVACVIGIALSGTRSAWFGLVAGTATWVVLRRDRRQILAVAGLAIALLVLVATVPQAAAFLADRAQTSISTGGSGRTEIWSVGLGIVASSPVIGVGLGNFPIAFTPALVAQVAASALGTDIGVGRAAHNVLLAITAELGLIGGLMLVALVASAIVAPARDRVAWTVRAAIIALAVQSMFLDILEQKQLWLVLALAFGLAGARRRELAEAAAARSGPAGSVADGAPGAAPAATPGGASPGLGLPPLGRARGPGRT